MADTINENVWQKRFEAVDAFANLLARECEAAAAREKAAVKARNDAVIAAAIGKGISVETCHGTLFGTIRTARVTRNARHWEITIDHDGTVKGPYLVKKLPA